MKTTCPSSDSAPPIAASWHATPPTAMFATTSKNASPRLFKPMMIKEVAEEVGVHPSTVSRAVASKYAHTSQGVLELRSFFSESVNGPEGSGMSLLTLKRLVKKMIEEEDTTKPLTDEQIAKKLDDAGIHVTRRTVAKYREDMRIPSTHQRRVKS
jgi:RNA polymerase sigma-54 factor